MMDSELFRDAVNELAAGLSVELQKAVGKLTVEDAPAIQKLSEASLRWAARAATGHPNAAQNLLHVEAQVAQLIAGKAVEAPKQIEAALLHAATFGSKLLAGLITVAVNRLVGLPILPVVQDPA